MIVLRYINYSYCNNNNLQLNNSYSNPGIRNQNYSRNINHFNNHCGYHNHNNHNDNDNDNHNSYNYFYSSNSGYHGKLKTLH